MNLTEKAREVFSADRYVSNLGITIEEVQNHSCRCMLHTQEQHSNARGVVMGGVLFTLADFSAAVAANSDGIATGDLQWVSLDATIHYLSPCPIGTLAAYCTPLKTGRTTALFQTKIHSLDNGKLVAIVETTMIHV